MRADSIACSSRDCHGLNACAWLIVSLQLAQRQLQHHQQYYVCQQQGHTASAAASPCSCSSRLCKKGQCKGAGTILHSYTWLTGCMPTTQQRCCLQLWLHEGPQHSMRQVALSYRAGSQHHHHQQQQQQLLLHNKHCQLGCLLPRTQFCSYPQLPPPPLPVHWAAAQPLHGS